METTLYERRVGGKKGRGREGEKERERESERGGGWMS